VVSVSEDPDQCKESSDNQKERNATKTTRREMKIKPINKDDGVISTKERVLAVEIFINIHLVNVKTVLRWHENCSAYESVREVPLQTLQSNTRFSGTLSKKMLWYFIG
jgi:hypothetical protein